VSEENIALVRRGIESVDAFWEMLDDEVVWELGDSRVPGLDRAYVGRDAVIKGSRQYWGTWIDYRVEAVEVLDADPSVVVILRESGRGKGSGAPFERSHPQLWTFRDGRIIRWASFQTRAEAVAAAGLRG
jgi:ketosteroid isomerase-like protein